VSAEKGGGDRLLSPFGAGANQPERVRHLATFAQRAEEECADSSSASVILQHPRTGLEWWVVADVLIVPAREFGDPITVGIEVESRDRSLHASRVMP